MMAITHAAIAAAFVPLVLSDTSPTTLGLAIVGSQLPDLDTSTSTIGQILYPLSSFLEKRYPHRTVTHSFLAIAFVCVLWRFVTLGVGYMRWYEFSQSEWLSLWLGMFFSIISDTFTVQGCQLFWPVPVWCYSGSSWDKKRIRTGSSAEITIVAVAAALAIWVIFGGFFSSGGVVSSITQNLGVGAAVINAYNRDAGSHRMFAEIKGNFVSDRSPIEGRYEIVAMQGKGFVLRLNDRIYQTGVHIETRSLKVLKGDSVKIVVYAVPFDDEPIASKLILLRETHPGDTILLTGSLTVDLPEEISTVPEVQSAQTLEISGTTAKLFYIDINQAINKMESQYGSGTVKARVIAVN